MKVIRAVRPVRAGIFGLLAVALCATLSLAAPTPASAASRAKTIHRDTVIARSKSWVKKRVPYSQRRYHKGYRQDCSGFVSMAWQLGRSYTSRSLPRVGKRIKPAHAKPGDAVVVPGHAVIFAGWKNKKKTFYAYEEPQPGGHAHKRVRKLRGNAKVLRRPGIQG